MDTLTREQLLKDIRDALNHLEDPTYLRRSPLAVIFGVADRYDTPSALRKILTEAIERLEPSPKAPSDSRAWRIYESVYYRYVEAYDQEAVARQLGISVRQLRREQQAALEAMLLDLWERYDLGKAGDGAAAGTDDAEPAPAATMSEEFAWLRDVPPESPTDLSDTLRSTVDLAFPLAGRHGVHLRVKMPHQGVPHLAVDPIGLRQILLNLLGVAIPRVPGGTVSITVEPLTWEVRVTIRCEARASGSQTGAEEERARLAMACQLANLCRLGLAVSATDTFEAVLTLPALQQLPVLAIDDNAGALELFQRYTEGTRYRLMGTRDPGQAVDLAVRLQPQIIVLDVMMPRIDGWEVLVRLRQHPLTGHIPIIVCTIQAQEELALSLGASAFLCKPVTRRAFLTALDGQVDHLAREPH